MHNFWGSFHLARIWSKRTKKRTVSIVNVITGKSFLCFGWGWDFYVLSCVFKWDDGHLYAPEYVSKQFAKLLKKYDLPPIRFHELRHSCASLLLNAGFTLKDVQEWMGHADIKMTADIYGHLDTARKQSMADKLSGSLFD